MFARLVQFLESFFSEKETCILKLLSEQDRSGLELIEASDGKLKRGSVYVYLAALEDQGLVEYVPDGSRRYRITERGRTEYARRVT